MVALSSRIGECLALTWSDVYDNEDKHEPSYIRNYKELTYRTENFIKETNGRGILKVFDQVRSTRPDAKRRAVFHVTKTEKEIEAKTDRIYIAPEVIFMLRDYRLVQNQHKQLAGDSYIDDDLIFAHEDGTHISSQYADDMFRSLYEPLGLPKVDLYKAAFYDLFIDLNHSTNLRTTAKELLVPERRFVRFLLEKRFVYRTASGNVLPYMDKISFALSYRTFSSMFCIRQSIRILLNTCVLYLLIQNLLSA